MSVTCSTVHACQPWVGCHRSGDVQVLDPFVSPPLARLSVADVVRRFNACLRSKGVHADDAVVAECSLLQSIAKQIVNK